MPPPALKARVLAAADRTSQQPPKVTSIDAAGEPRAGLPAGGRRGRRRPRGRRWASASRRCRARRPRRPGRRRSPRSSRPRTPHVRPSTPSRRRRSAWPRRPSADEMAVDTTDLQSLSSREVYQLWTIATATPHSVAVARRPGRARRCRCRRPARRSRSRSSRPAGSDQPTTDADRRGGPGVRLSRGHLPACPGPTGRGAAPGVGWTSGQAAASRAARASQHRLRGVVPTDPADRPAAPGARAAQHHVREVGGDAPALRRGVQPAPGSGPTARPGRRGRCGRLASPAPRRCPAEPWPPGTAGRRGRGPAATRPAPRGAR